MMRLALGFILQHPPTLTLPHAGGGKRAFLQTLSLLKGCCASLQRGEGRALSGGCGGFERALPSPRCGGGSGWGGFPIWGACPL